MQSSNEQGEQAFYDQIAEELARDSVVPGLWTRAFAEANGDRERAKALYIKFRLRELVAEAGSPSSSEPNKQTQSAHTPDHSRKGIEHESQEDAQSGPTTKTGLLLWWMFLFLGSWLATLLTSGLSGYPFFVPDAEQEYYLRVAASALGEAFGFFAIALILTCLFWLVFRLTKNRMGPVWFLKFLSITLGLLLLVNYLAQRFPPDSGNAHTRAVIAEVERRKRSGQALPTRMDLDRLYQSINVARQARTLTPEMTNEEFMLKALENSHSIQPRVKVDPFPFTGEVSYWTYDSTWEDSLVWESLPFSDADLVYCAYSKLVNEGIPLMAFYVIHESKEVQFVQNGPPDEDSPLAPFLPYRTDDGNVVFPH